MKLSHYRHDLLHIFTTALVIVAFLGSFRPMAVYAATEYNARISFTDDFDACSGERITVNAVQHITGHVTKDANDRFHYVFTRNTQGKGLGQTSGDQYLLIDTVTQLNLEVLPGQTQMLSQEYHSVLIHQGEKLPGDDTIIHFLSKLTIDASGGVTTLIEIQDVECR